MSNDLMAKAHFETETARRADCSKIACLMRDQNRQAIIMLGLDPDRELVQAFDETPNPTAWQINGELAAMGGFAGPLMLCPIGIAWLVVAEHASRFRHALVRELRRQFDVAQQAYPILVAPLFPADKTSLRFSAFFGFDVEHGYPEKGLLFAVRTKKEAAS
jgi:hypothetical protein